MVEAVKLNSIKQSANSNTSQRTNQWPSHPSGYKLEMAIGIGSFGIVWKAQCIEGLRGGQNVAIKILDMRNFED